MSRFSPHEVHRPSCLDSRRTVGGCQRGFHLLAAVSPVLGQSGVIRGRPAFDQGVPHDTGPGRFRQVGAGVAVAEDPPVVPEFAELSVVPADDPVLGLVRVAPARPLVGELPQVVAQGSEHPGRHHSPVVGAPAPCDRDDPRQHRCDVGPSECAELPRKPFPEPHDGRFARLDEQLAVRVAAEAVNPRKPNPSRRRTVLSLLASLKARPAQRQPSGRLCLDLLGLLPGITAYDQVIGISSKRRAAASSLPRHECRFDSGRLRPPPARAMRYSTAKVISPPRALPARPRHGLAGLETPPPGPLALVPPAHTPRPRYRDRPGQLAIGCCRTRRDGCRTGGRAFRRHLRLPGHRPQPDLPDRPGTPPPTRARANTAPRTTWRAAPGPSTAVRPPCSMCSDRHCSPPGKQLGEVFGTYRKPAQRLAEQLGYEKNGMRAGRELRNGSRSRAAG